MPTGWPTTPPACAVEEALVPLASTLQAFSTNISEVLIPSTVQQRDGACPSGAWRGSELRELGIRLPDACV